MLIRQLNRQYSYSLTRHDKQLQNYYCKKLIHQYPVHYLAVGSPNPSVVNDKDSIILFDSGVEPGYQVLRGTTRCRSFYNSRALGCCWCLWNTFTKAKVSVASSKATLKVYRPTGAVLSCWLTSSVDILQKSTELCMLQAMLINTVAEYTDRNRKLPAVNA